MVLQLFLFALPAIFYNWQILFFIAAMFPFVLVSIYYTKKKDERNLLNDLAGIAIFALAGMGSYYFSDRTFDEKNLVGSAVSKLILYWYHALRQINDA